MQALGVRKPRVVFMGEKPLAERCLEDLLGRECTIAGIATRAVTSATWWGPNTVRSIAEANNIPIVKRADIAALRPDVLLSVLYPFIVEAPVLAAADRAYNLHLAPLPEYRGRNCGSHALIDGDTRFGVTLHEMIPELDQGRIVEKRYFPLSMTDTARTLYDKAVQTGFDVWRDNIDRLLAGTVSFAVSEPTTTTSKLFGPDSLDNKRIPQTTDRRAIYNFVRGLDFEPFEAAYFITNANTKVSLRQADFDTATFQLTHPENERALRVYLQQARP